MDKEEPMKGYLNLRRFSSNLKVSDLIEYLSAFDPDTPINNCGDSEVFIHVFGHPDKKIISGISFDNENLDDDYFYDGIYDESEIYKQVLDITDEKSKEDMMMVVQMPGNSVIKNLGRAIVNYVKSLKVNAQVSTTVQDRENDYTVKVDVDPNKTDKVSVQFSSNPKENKPIRPIYFMDDNGNKIEE